MNLTRSRKSIPTNSYFLKKEYEILYEKYKNMNINECIPYKHGEIITVDEDHMSYAKKQFSSTNIRPLEKTLGFAAQWQVEGDILYYLQSKNKKIIIPDDDYGPYDLIINDNYYDIKTSINGNTITISNKEAKFATKNNTQFICLKYRLDLGDNKFEFIKTISFYDLLKLNILQKSKYNNGFYVFISDLK